jgi:pimeloyl-ACP methyl ester carboxylesterase
MAERMIEANGVELCTEPFGDPGAPPVLLVMGVSASMLWWEEGFCRLLAENGRFVIRYDHRDTGRSVTYEPGRPQYTGADLGADAVGVLDAYEIPAAHVVGVSAGGGFAQLLALGFRERISSLVLISTTPATPGERSLPSATERFSSFLASAEWTGRIKSRSPSTWSATSACSQEACVPSTRRPGASWFAARSSARVTSPPLRTTP